MKTNMIIALLLFVWTAVYADARGIRYAAGHKKSTKVKSADIMTISQGRFPSWMVKVQGGSYRMGSERGYDYERPVHPVTVGDFYMSKFEVTQYS
jgi:formylglycine-generating enzyme required for sulfatase activity